MIAELVNARDNVAAFEISINLAADINNEVATGMRFGVLPKLTEKVEKIQAAIDDLIKTQHILFETPFYEKAYISVFRDGKTIVKTYDLHENENNQDWALTRSKERFENGHKSDDEGYYWAIVRYDCYLAQTHATRTWICHFALTPTEGNSLFQQLNDWQNDRDDGTSESPNYIYFPEPILCHTCNNVATEVHKKSINGYSYYYCRQECVCVDFSTCSGCGETEVSKIDCTDGSYGCCMQYLGGKPQYYCSERCKDEDTTEFVRSFRIEGTPGSP